MSQWACLGASDAENLGRSHCVVDEGVCGIEGACQCVPQDVDVSSMLRFDTVEVRREAEFGEDTGVAVRASVRSRLKLGRGETTDFKITYNQQLDLKRDLRLILPGFPRLDTWPSTQPPRRRPTPPSLHQRTWQPTSLEPCTDTLSQAPSSSLSPAHPSTTYVSASSALPLTSS